MFSILKTTFNKILPLQAQMPLQVTVNKFHFLTNSTSQLTASTVSSALGGLSALSNGLTHFLKPQNPSLVPSCGFKVMGKVRRRCKDCYLVRREERLYNICKTHRRHKQMSMVKKPKNTWILTHATQSKVRPW